MYNEEKFKKDLEHLINCCSMETESSTPDFVSECEKDTIE